MAKLFLIGVCHNDPFGAEKTRYALRLAQENNFIPDCIAVEWRSDYANRVILQRDTFGRLLAQEYPNITDGELQIIQSSLAFEADAHIRRFLLFGLMKIELLRMILLRIMQRLVYL